MMDDTVAAPPGAEKYGRARRFRPYDATQGDYVLPGEATAPSHEMQIEWFDDAADAALSEPNNPLIDGLLDEGAMSVVYGDSNSGKTFVALDMAFCAATGRPWNGKKVKHSLVIYVAAEGGKRIKRRLAVLKKRYIEQRGEDATKPLFALVRYPIDLRSNDANLKELLALIRAAE